MCGSLVEEEVSRVGERGERGAGGRRRVGEARVEALGALVHDRPRLQKGREEMGMGKIVTLREVNFPTD